MTTTHTTLEEGSSASLSVTATDPDGDPLTYSWTGALDNQPHRQQWDDATTVRATHHPPRFE
ncbi:MAG TPA: hypothetical protein VE057_05685 [Archangium sp.]|nr:hypothetical protein [Archangium sp.]